MALRCLGPALSPGQRQTCTQQFAEFPSAFPRDVFRCCTVLGRCGDQGRTDWTLQGTNWLCWPMVGGGVPGLCGQCSSEKYDVFWAFLA